MRPEILLGAELRGLRRGPWLQQKLNSVWIVEFEGAATFRSLPRFECEIVLLVQRVEGEDARFRVRALSGRVDTHNGVFLGAEATNTGLVDRDRRRLNGVANVDAVHRGSRTGREHVARLSAASGIAVVRHHGVKQAVVELGVQAAPKAPPRSTSAPA